MRNIIIILCCLIGFSVAAQENKCGWYGKKTVEERNRIFPFNKTSRAVLIAYSNYELVPSELKMADSLTVEEAKAIDSSIIGKYEFQPEGSERPRVYFITEEKELDVIGKNELSNILCNYVFVKKAKPVLYSQSMCYTPRNSILFFDDNNEIICCMEICFQCGGNSLSPDPEGLNEYADVPECHDRLNEIKKIFSKNGIVYGIKE